jgi:hypothetical protein
MLRGFPLPISQRAVFVLLSFLIAFSVPTAALIGTPLQHPKRRVNSYTIDLGPLFRWWGKHEGPRPLSSWVHIRGSVVGTNAGGWIVEGHAEGSSGNQDSTRRNGAGVTETSKLLLQNPPIEDLAEFANLSGELNGLVEQKARLTEQETQTHQREQSVNSQEHAARHRSGEARVLAAEDKQLRRAETNFKADQQTLDQRIKELKARLAALVNADHYQVDCFALDLQYDYGQLPVYDHGLISK